MAAVAVLGAAAYGAWRRGSRALARVRCEAGVSASLSSWEVNSVQTTCNTMHFTGPVSFGRRNNKVLGISVAGCIIHAKLFLFTEENLIFFKKSNSLVKCIIRKSVCIYSK